MRRFRVKDVGSYLRHGDYTDWHREWQSDKRRGDNTAYHPWGTEADSDIDQEEWLENVLIPSWQALEPVYCYDDGTVCGFRGNTAIWREPVDLDYASGLTGEVFAEYAEKFGFEIEEL